MRARVRVRERVRVMARERERARSVHLVAVRASTREAERVVEAAADARVAAHGDADDGVGVGRAAHGGGDAGAEVPGEHET